MRRIVPCLLLAAALAGCGAGSAGTRAPASVHRSAPAHTLARWTTFVHERRPVDLAGPRAAGSFILAANGRLWALKPSGATTPLAPGYRVSSGEEAYIAIGPPRSCFTAGMIYAIRLHSGRGVTEIDRAGRVRRFAAVSAPGLINGIAFDTTGHFAHRLLLTVNAGRRTAVLAVDCGGRVKTVTGSAPRVEGGIAVAPASFGRFGGDLIAPDEISGNVYAISPAGDSTRIAASGIPHGQDTGVESEAFMPARRLRAVLVADRLTHGNHHPGDDVILRIGPGALVGAGVAPGDLLVVSEGGAQAIAVRCAGAGCRVVHVAGGPSRAHVEGHVVVSGQG